MTIVYVNLCHMTYVVCSMLQTSKKFFHSLVTLLWLSDGSNLKLHLTWIVFFGRSRCSDTARPRGYLITPPGAHCTPLSSHGEDSASDEAGPSSRPSGIGSWTLPLATTPQHPPLRGSGRGRHGRTTQLGGRDYYVSTFAPRAMEAAEIAVRQLFYTCDLPFHVARTPAWRRMMTTISAIGQVWPGPSSEHLRTRALVAERASVDQQLEPLRRAWAQYVL